MLTLLSAYAIGTFFHMAVFAWLELANDVDDRDWWGVVTFACFWIGLYITLAIVFCFDPEKERKPHASAQLEEDP